MRGFEYERVTKIINFIWINFFYMESGLRFSSRRRSDVLEINNNIIDAIRRFYFNLYMNER